MTGLDLGGARNFSWVVPGKLAACAVPRSLTHLRDLYNKGLRVIITLMENPPAPEIA